MSAEWVRCRRLRGIFVKKIFKKGISLLCAAALVLGCAACSGGSPKQTAVTDITVWTYYNGDQMESFTKLVDEFNSTVGAEKGISVSTESLGSVNDLEASVMDAAEGKVGASELPNIFSAYADTAYAMDQMGMLVDLAPYLSDAERNTFVNGYLSEGDFNGSGEIKIFPVAKATELMFLNDTDWQATTTLPRWKVWWKRQANTTTGPTLRPIPPMTARLCSAATPWPTICW